MKTKNKIKFYYFNIFILIGKYIIRVEIFPTESKGVQAENGTLKLRLKMSILFQPSYLEQQKADTIQSDCLSEWCRPAVIPGTSTGRALAI